jgi:hypothetical protein
VSYVVPGGVLNVPPDAGPWGLEPTGDVVTQLGSGGLRRAVTFHLQSIEHGSCDDSLAALAADGSGSLQSLSARPAYLPSWLGRQVLSGPGLMG